MATPLPACRRALSRLALPPSPLLSLPSLALLSSLSSLSSTLEPFRRHVSTSLQPRLAFEELAAPESGEGSRRLTAVIIHGLLGAGRNWRSPARSLLEAAAAADVARSYSATWRILLVDLRNHGRSAELADLRGPHTMAAAATDVATLLEEAGGAEVVIGHSLGGKVALEYARMAGTRGSAGALQKLKQVWVLDSVPGPVAEREKEQSGDVEKVLATLRSLPSRIPSRRWLVARLQEEGYSQGLSEWVATNLKREGGGSASEEMSWLFNVEGAAQMYDSYREWSCMDLLDEPPEGMRIDLVRAELSDRWHPGVLLPVERAVEESERREREGGRGRGRVAFHLLPKAGHWLHMDNPKGLVELLAPSLVRIMSEE